MRITPSPVLKDILVIEPDVHADSRGYFLELFREPRYRDIIPERFVQDNLSLSGKGVVRGLHYQIGKPQGKLVTVLEGEILDVAADIRRGSPTFGAHDAVTLSGANHLEVYIPAGFAHGFLVTGERALVLYKCTALYDPAAERGIRWDDPTLAVPWPVRDPVLSGRDRTMPFLTDIGDADLPEW